MTAINQLSTGTITAADLLVFFSSSNGDTRKVSLSDLATALDPLLAVSDGMVTQYFSPNATGFSVGITDDQQSRWLLITPLAGYAAGTVVLPATPTDRQEVLVSTTQAVTALTVNGNGNPVNGAPATLAANGFFRLRYDGVNDSWYRAG